MTGEDLDAVHVGQAHVEHDHADRPDRPPSARGPSPPSSARSVSKPALAEDLVDRLEEEDLVVDDQYATAGGGVASARILSPWSHPPAMPVSRESRLPYRMNCERSGSSSRSPEPFVRPSPRSTTTRLLRPDPEPRRRAPRAGAPSRCAGASGADVGGALVHRGGDLGDRGDAVLGSKTQVGCPRWPSRASNTAGRASSWAP